MAVGFITVGALMDVWTTIWYLFYLRDNPSVDRRFYCLGLFLSGLVLMLIGLAVRRIERSARQAEVAPPVPGAAVMPPAGAGAMVAPSAMPAAPAGTAAPMMPMNGQVVAQVPGAVPPPGTVVR